MIAPDTALAGAALIAAGVAALVAGLAATVAALHRNPDADLTVADGIDDLARVARAAGVWVEDEVDPVEWREPYA